MSEQDQASRAAAGRDLVEAARSFATREHRRIDHRRKYTGQPYEHHLRAVAAMVSEVTDDPHAVAAAWLHDAVEDTEATFGDVERRFGPEIARLVAEVTDVSRPSDGNRACRKALDREHLSRASPLAQTIKLADLTDNCRDICRNDPRFARVFLGEMEDLLGVLVDGDPRLAARARKALEKGRALVSKGSPPAEAAAAASAAPFSPIAAAAGERALRLFVEAFRASDVAEPLRSFDAERPAEDVAALLGATGASIAAVRRDGLVSGRVRAADLSGGSCGDAARPFAPGEVLDDDAPLAEVLLVLSRHDHCFVRAVGGVSGVVTREQVQSPVVRTWLFGLVTLTELTITDRIRARWPDDGWTAALSPARLRKARELQEERLRREQRSELLDCLQLADKADVLLSSEDEVAAFGFDSRRAARKVVQELQSLRNNLAHAQDVVTHDWPQVARLARRIAELSGVR